MTKPNIIIPNSFAANGDKTDFDESHIINGFPTLTPDVLRGDNLNKFIDDTYKGLNGVLELYEGCVLYDSTVTYTNKSLVFDITNDGIKFYHSLQNGNINHALTDADYWEEVSLGGGSSRNIGEIVASTIPLTDAGLHLLDGALIDGSGSYSAFVDYIADLYEQDPTANYFAQARTESEVSWTQPTLTQNGTMGGDEFACAASSYPNVYRAFNSTNTQNVNSTSTSETIDFYNPNPLKVTSIVWNVYDLNRNPINYTVQGSNDGSNYTDIITNQTSVAGSSTTMDLSANTNFYKYYKIIVHTFNTNVGNLKTLSISATQLVGDAKTAEEVWQETVTNYGVCGKFVYDSVNNTVRLPKYSNKIYTKNINSTAPVVGNGMAVGLTDGTYNAGLSMWNPQYGASLIARQDQYGDVVGSSSATNNVLSLNKAVGVTSVPAYSGLIAQLSEITTSIDGYYYIVIATTTKTDIQVDIDQIATDLNGKADTDLSNVSNTSGFRRLIDIYNNGTSWYKVYAEYDPTTGDYIGKWCGQGSFFTFDSSPKTVSLLKEYTDTNYSIYATNVWTNNFTDAALAVNVNNKTTSSFQAYSPSNNTNSAYCYWRVCGYIN